MSFRRMASAIDSIETTRSRYSWLSEVCGPWPRQLKLSTAMQR